MITFLAQATDTTSAAGGSLKSISGIILATWVVVALLKHLIGFQGKAVLAVSLVVSLTFAGVGLFVTKTLPGDPIEVILAVLILIAGAAGINASGSTLFKKTAPPLMAVLLLGACSSIPTYLVEEHLNAVQPHHTALIDQHRSQDAETWDAHYESMRELIEQSR